MPTDAMPAKYDAPLTRAADMRAYLLNRRSHDGYPFAFDVKVYAADLSFKNLLSIAGAGGSDVMGDAEWVDAAAREYDRAARQVEDVAMSDARELVTDSDAYRTTWSGDDIDVAYGWAGRSGGWLVITELDGMRFTERTTAGEFREWVGSLDRKELRKLYRFIVQCEADFTRASACHEVEYQAASYFFHAHLSGVPTMPAKLAAQDAGAGI